MNVDYTYILRGNRMFNQLDLELQAIVSPEIRTRKSSKGSDSRS